MTDNPESSPSQPIRFESWTERRDRNPELWDKLLAHIMVDNPYRPAFEVVDGIIQIFESQDGSESPR